MAVNQFDREDYLEVARERVTEQFKEKPIFDRFLQVLLSGKFDIQNALEDLQTLRSLDTATGKQLDIIGDIVGRPRGLVYQDIFNYFGFAGTERAGSFGSLSDPKVGAPWYSVGAPTGNAREPSDEEYRMILKAKIIKNRTNSTPEQVIEAYKFVFGVPEVFLEEYAPAAVRIGIGKILTNVERSLLFDLGGAGALLPKTIGVNYTYTEFQAGRVFATEGFPGGQGVGDLNDPTVGGILTNLVT
ncbi:structural protein [Pseudomonas phage vB_VIPPAEUMC01]|uniref:Structural protein n=1 Tax=Pseudomonas phage vB_VIPPAEUMC01 TaxID=3034284 RepID=A0AAF0G0Z4_9CAUD|nr:structural protein [Pseudomonas phage vB_VIPPAEUMC01]